MCGQTKKTTKICQDSQCPGHDWETSTSEIQVRSITASANLLNCTQQLWEGQCQQCITSQHQKLHINMEYWQDEKEGEERGAS